MEIVRRYANRLDLLHDLGKLLGRAPLEATSSEELGAFADAAQRGRQRHVLARLSDGDVRRIVAGFAAGTPKHLLAAEYGLSLSSVKRLLRRQRAQAESVSLVPA